jgi:DHA1 family tetracycline resistance protein-like MFS transporter
MSGVALGAGFIVGPLIGVVLSGYGPHVPALVAGGLALGSTLLAWWRLPESLPASTRATPTAPRELNAFAPLRMALGRGSLRPLLIATFLANFAMAALRSHFAFFTFATLAFSQRDTSTVIAFLGVMMVVAQGGLVRQAVRRWGDHGTLVIGLAVSVAGFAGLSVSTTPFMLYVMVAITAVGVGLGTPTMAALVSHRSGAVEQGVMLGAAQAAASLAQIVGPLWAGFVFDYAGPAFPFSTGAALVAAALAVVLLSRPR